MINLSWLLERVFALHGSIPRRLWRSGGAFSPVHLLMEVTYRCNLRCNFCQYLDIIEGKKKPYGPSQKDLDLPSILRWIDEFPRGRLISFVGGETLVRKDFPQILAHAARHHRVHIITNGVLIDEAVAKSYIELAPRWPWQNGLVLLELSLQGGERTHDDVVQRPGSWRKSVDGMRHLIRLRRESGSPFPKLDFKLAVTRDTVDEMVPIMHFAREMGVDLVNFLAEHDLKGNSEGERPEHLWRAQNPPAGVDPFRLRKHLIRCYELGRELGLQVRLTPNVPIDEFVRHYTADRDLRSSEYVCDGVWSRIGVAADGRTGPLCPYFANGDMRTESLRGSWNSERLREFRRLVRDERVFPGCHGCCNLRYVGDQPLGLAGVEVGSTGPARAPLEALPALPLSVSASRAIAPTEPELSE